MPNSEDHSSSIRAALSSGLGLHWQQKETVLGFLMTKRVPSQVMPLGIKTLGTNCYIPWDEQIHLIYSCLKS